MCPGSKATIMILDLRGYQGFFSWVGTLIDEALSRYKNSMLEIFIANSEQSSPFLPSLNWGEGGIFVNIAMGVCAHAVNEG